MKKMVAFVFSVFLCMVSVCAEEGTVEQIINADVKTRGLTKLISRGVGITYSGDDLYDDNYLLAEDNSGTLYLYYREMLGFDDNLRCIKANKKVDKDYVAEQMNISEKSSKVMEAAGYVVYKITMKGLIINYDTYIVRTPNSNFYTLEEGVAYFDISKIRSKKESQSLIDEL